MTVAIQFGTGKPYQKTILFQEKGEAMKKAKKAAPKKKKGAKKPAKKSC